MSRMLLILDMDETLIHSTTEKLDYDCHFYCNPYFVYKRPGLSVFLRKCDKIFDLAIWSAGSATYVQDIVSHIVPDSIKLKFVWNRERCTVISGRELRYLKDLKKIKRKGFPLTKTLIVEDSPSAVERNYGNAIYIKPYLGDLLDMELEALGQYLEIFQKVKDVRKLEKRNWRNHRG